MSIASFAVENGCCRFLEKGECSGASQDFRIATKEEVTNDFTALSFYCTHDMKCRRPAINSGAKKAAKSITQALTGFVQDEFAEQ